YDVRWLMAVMSHHDELALVAEAAQPTVVHPELAAVAMTVLETTTATVAELGGWLAQWRNDP
ncbi:MAG TPA: hypothetical protein VGE07_06475, partial [Herpetosiphonaceae bacterium]